MTEAKQRPHDNADQPKAGGSCPYAELVRAGGHCVRDRQKNEMEPCVMTALRTKQPRQHDDAHRKFIASLPCCVCGDNTSTECAHIRFADATVDKRAVGTGEKADDCWTLPLCNQHHREQHGMGERQFWRWVPDNPIDPTRVALALYRVTGDHAAGCRIIEAIRA